MVLISGAQPAQANLPKLEPLSISSSHAAGSTHSVTAGTLFSFSATFPTGTKVTMWSGGKSSDSPYTGGAITNLATEIASKSWAIGRSHSVQVQLYAEKNGFTNFIATWNFNVTCPEIVEVRHDVKPSGTKITVTNVKDWPSLTYWVSSSDPTSGSTAGFVTRNEIKDVAFFLRRNLGNDSVRFTLTARDTRDGCHAFQQEMSAPLGLQSVVRMQSSGSVNVSPGDTVSLETATDVRALGYEWGNISWRYNWWLDGVLVKSNSPYTVQAADVGKVLDLEATAYYNPDWNLSYKFGNLSSNQKFRSADSVKVSPRVQPSPTVSALPTPSPSATSSPVLNPQVPSQPRENVGGNPSQSPNPSPSVSQSAKPTTSPSPTANPIPSAKPSSSPKAVVYKSCTSLRLKFKNGVARDSKALSRHKLKTKPVLNSSVYSANARLDTDKDGLVCER
jgi:hypothetical protein